MTSGTMLAASVLQVTDLFAVGIGFDIAGAYLLARGLLISPHGLWVRFTIAGADTRFVDEAKDRVMAVVGLGALASGFVIQAFGYALSPLPSSRPTTSPSRQRSLPSPSRPSQPS